MSIEGLETESSKVNHQESRQALESTVRTSESRIDDLYPPPKSLELPMETFERILISGAPTNPYRTAQAAMQKPQMSLYENATIEVMDDIKQGLRYIFQTKNPWTFALTGHGHIGIECVLDNILEPGDTILIPVSGMWGLRVSDSASRLGAIVKNIEKPHGSAFSLEELEAAIKEHRPQAVYLVNGESSTGVQQSVEGVGEICHKYDCLLLVDLVATIAVVPFYFDKWKVDAAFSNSHKGIGAPVGLAPISFGTRAVAKIMRRKTKPSSYRTDMKNWLETNYWQMDKERIQTFHHSLPVLMFYAVREALAMVSKEGLEDIWIRHANATQRLYNGIEKLGLKYYVPNPKDRLVGTIMLHPPKGVAPRDIMLYVRAKHSVDLGVGLGPTLNKAIRVGLLGPNASSAVVDKVLLALKDAFIYFGALPKEEP